jgi:hypothetical protein
MKVQLLVTLVALVFGNVAASSVTWSESDSELILANGYTKMVFNKLTGSVTNLSGDFSGGGSFTKNTLALPFALKVALGHSPSGTSPTPALDGCTPVEGSEVQITWLEQSESFASFRAANILDRPYLNCTSSSSKVADRVDPIVSEDWTVSLRSTERAVTVAIRGHVLRAAEVKYVLHGVYSQSPSLYGLFDRGIAQMMGNSDACMGSAADAAPLPRAYVLGDGAALDVLRHGYGTPHLYNKPASVSPSASEKGDPTATSTNTRTSTSSTGVPGIFARTRTVLLSNHSAFASGLEDVLVGAYPDASADMFRAWAKGCWKGAEVSAVDPSMNWEFSYSFIPNNYDFPAYLLNSVADTQYTVPFDQLRAYLTGVYASPAGCLQSYYDKQFGTIAPTISHPDVGYSPDTNFFDPDNFISLSAMLYSGDLYLVQQVRDVLARTAQTMCGIGRDQDPVYCSGVAAASPQDTKNSSHRRARSHPRQHALFSTNRFNYSLDTAEPGKVLLLLSYWRYWCYFYYCMCAVVPQYFLLLLDVFLLLVSSLFIH